MIDFSTSDFGHINCKKVGFEPRIIDRMSNTVDPDKRAYCEPPHLDLHCLQWHLH